MMDGPRPRRVLDLGHVSGLHADDGETAARSLARFLTIRVGDAPRDLRVARDDERVEHLVDVLDAAAAQRGADHRLCFRRELDVVELDAVLDFFVSLGAREGGIVGRRQRAVAACGDAAREGADVTSDGVGHAHSALH
ncbi:protein of unknown function [Burkholderia multivorans]